MDKGRKRDRDSSPGRRRTRRSSPSSSSDSDDVSSRDRRQRPRLEATVRPISRDDEDVIEVKKAPAEEATAEGGRAGGVYIPPFKLALLEAKQGPVEKNSEQYQKRYWEALRKSINGLVNKVTVTNITKVVEELFGENLIRGRGLLARAILRAQLASPGFSNIFAALLAVINSKLPEVGELLLKRLLLQFRRSYKRNDRVVCTACVRFFAHLVNQNVVNELLALELCQLFLTTPTNESVELTCSFLKECGQVLQAETPSGMVAVSSRLREILMEGIVEKNTQYVIEEYFKVQSQKFSQFPGVLPDLDLIEDDDKITHEIELFEENIDAKKLLDIFQSRTPEQFAAEEQKWNEISNQILGLESSDDDKEKEEDDDEEDEAEEAEESGPSSEKKLIDIVDMTEQDLVHLRKTIYLCIMSSAQFEECVHKLLKLNVPEGAEKEVCNMIIDCCMMEKNFERFYAFMGERLAKLKNTYSDAFCLCFQQQFSTLHRQETNKLRNLAKYFAHLFATDAIPWTAMEIIVITEKDTTSASRIFVKNLFQELCNDMSLKKLQTRFAEPELLPYLKGVFPQDTIPNARFAINFFTAIGLSPLADTLRDQILQTRAAANQLSSV